MLKLGPQPLLLLPEVGETGRSGQAGRAGSPWGPWKGMLLCSHLSFQATTRGVALLCHTWPRNNRAEGPQTGTVRQKNPSSCEVLTSQVLYDKDEKLKNGRLIITMLSPIPKDSGNKHKASEAEMPTAAGVQVSEASRRAGVDSKKRNTHGISSRNMGSTQSQVT